MTGCDPAICRIDAAYFAKFQGGDQREAAHQMLMLTDHPVLDYARMMDAMDKVSTPQQAIKLLEKIKSERALTLEEGEALDFARAKNAGLRVVTLFPEADAAMPLAVVSGRKRADRDPLRGSVVAGYIILADRNALKNGGTVDRGEVEARLKKLLTAVP